jgi:hypothetical protein
MQFVVSSDGLPKGNLAVGMTRVSDVWGIDSSDVVL